MNRNTLFTKIEVLVHREQTKISLWIGKECAGTIQTPVIWAAPITMRLLSTEHESTPIHVKPDGASQPSALVVAREIAFMRHALNYLRNGAPDQYFQDRAVEEMLR